MLLLLIFDVYIPVVEEHLLLDIKCMSIIANLYTKGCSINTHSHSQTIGNYNVYDQRKNDDVFAKHLSLFPLISTHGNSICSEVSTNLP